MQTAQVDYLAAVARCDQRIAQLRMEVAALRSNPATWMRRHDLLRKIGDYQNAKKILEGGAL